MFNPQGPNHRLHKPPPEEVNNSQIQLTLDIVWCIK